MSTRLSFERAKTGWFHEIKVDVQTPIEPKIQVRFATATESSDNQPYFAQWTINEMDQRTTCRNNELARWSLAGREHWDPTVVFRDAVNPLFDALRLTNSGPPQGGDAVKDLNEQNV